MPDNSTKFQQDVPVKIPEWLNEKFFEKILLKEHPDFEKITRCLLITAMPPGENYASILLRVEMDFVMTDGYAKEKSYIVKSMLDKEKGGQLFSMFNLFPREKLMYERILPELEKFYSDRDKLVKFSPKSIWIEEHDGRITLVLEDLKRKKFRNINRLKGFDMQHMKRVLEKLAEFHAASVKWHEENGDYPDTLRRQFVNYHKPKYYEARVASYKEAMASWGWENYQQYSDRIPTVDQFVEASKQCFNTDPQDFRVLNHGDFWSNNIMVNYINNGKDISQLRFVDFQMCKWGNPAQDLWHLIICSAESNIRIKNFDQFVRIYHTHLKYCLKFLDCRTHIPKLLDIHIGMLKYSAWAYFTTFTHLVLILLPPNEEASVVKLIASGEEGDSFRKKAFSNPLYVRAVLDIFPFLFKRGILDFE